MNMSNDIAELTKALIAAQAEIEDPVKDKTAKTEKFSYTYTTLTDVLQGARPVLNKHGLGIMQLSEQSTSENGTVYAHVETVIIHNSGQWISGVMTMPVDAKPNLSFAQSFGSVFAYARRYSLLAALGLGAEDNDGKTQEPRQAPQAKPKELWINTQEAAEARTNLNKAKSLLGTEVVSQVLGVHGCETISDIQDAKQADAILSDLRERRKVNGTKKTAEPQQSLLDQVNSQP